VEDLAATLIDIGIGDAVQVVGLKGIGQLLDAIGIVDADKAVTKTNSDCDELACQPGMTVAVELQFELAPGGGTQTTKPQLDVHEIARLVLTCLV